MRARGLEAVTRLRRFEERQSRIALALSLARERATREAIPPFRAPVLPPTAPIDELRRETQYSELNQVHRRNAVAEAAEAARAGWARAAADHRALERLLDRRRHEERARAEKRAQAHLDEVAVVAWWRDAGHRSAAGPGRS